MNASIYQHQANLKLWADRIAEQKSSGLKIDEWCLKLLLLTPFISSRIVKLVQVVQVADLYLQMLLKSLHQIYR